MNKIIIGLTGGIASGKSEAAKEFERLGCDVVDTDIIAKKVVRKGSAGEALLLKEFPQASTEGVICRQKLRELVFRHECHRQKLNAIMHPLILSEAKKQIESSINDIIVLVVPLLFETGFDSLTNINVSVSCNEDMRIQRLIKRDNITVELAQKMLDSQLSEKERNQKSDYVIINEGDAQNLKNEVQKFLEHIKSTKLYQ